MKAEDLEPCDEMKYNKKVKNTSYGGVELDPDDIAYPCGMIARYYFTDEFGYMKDGENVGEKEVDLVWIKYDQYKFKNLKVNPARY